MLKKNNFRRNTVKYKKSKKHKSPGTDGLISEFYKTFADEVAKCLLAVHNESFCKEELPLSLQVCSP